MLWNADTADLSSSEKRTEPSPNRKGSLATPLIDAVFTLTFSERLGRKGTKVTIVCASAPAPRATVMNSPPEKSPVISKLEPPTETVAALALVATFKAVRPINAP